MHFCVFCVSHQEWTLPPWGKLLDLKPLVYRNRPTEKGGGGAFPRDNTPSGTAVIAGYVQVYCSTAVLTIVGISRHTSILYTSEPGNLV